ncbi:MAG: hypothetical protein KME22_01700, partial [Hassallia sp. WJT32-NPBG1]|nr:hypothetical protein [Hassallia sp. WJT32-NPBG1]
MSEAFRCEAISNHCDCLIPHMSGKPLYKAYSNLINTYQSYSIGFEFRLLPCFILATWALTSPQAQT